MRTGACRQYGEVFSLLGEKIMIPLCFEFPIASHMFIFSKIYLKLNFSKYTGDPDKN